MKYACVCQNGPATEGQSTFRSCIDRIVVAFFVVHHRVWLIVRGLNCEPGTREVDQNKHQAETKIQCTRIFGRLALRVVLKDHTAVKSPICRKPSSKVINWFLKYV